MVDKEKFEAMLRESKKTSSKNSRLFAGLTWLVNVMRYLVRQGVRGVIEFEKEVMKLLLMLAAATGAGCWVLLFFLGLDVTLQVLLEDGKKPLTHMAKSILKPRDNGSVEAIQAPKLGRLVASSDVGLATSIQAIDVPETVFESSIEEKELPMLGMAELIREELDEHGRSTKECIEKGNKLFSKGWAWGLHNGEMVAMPAAKGRHASSELLEWWMFHDPERYEQYMQEGPYGSGWGLGRPDVQDGMSVEAKLEEIAKHLRRVEEALGQQQDSKRENLRELEKQEARVLAGLRGLETTDKFVGSGSMKMSTMMTREFKISAKSLRGVEEQLRQKHGVARDRLRETEIELSQVKAALKGLDVAIFQDDKPQLNIEKSLDDLFGVLETAHATSHGAQP